MSDSCAVLDIGNSHAKLAYVTDGKFPAEWRTPSSAPSSDVRISLIPFMKQYPKARLAICSVVPSATEVWTQAWLEGGGDPPFLVNSAAHFSFINEYLPPEAIGADRLAACEAAVRAFSLPVAVFSFGTALAVTVVDGGRKLRGGFIFPGFGLAAASLRSHTALLDISAPPTSKEEIGDNTQDNLARGIYNGFVGAIKEMRSVIDRELGTRALAVATGRDAARFSRLFDAVDDGLIIRGTFFCWQIRRSA